MKSLGITNAVFTKSDEVYIDGEKVRASYFKNSVEQLVGKVKSVKLGKGSMRGFVMVTQGGDFYPLSIV